ncbi:hypothetical protein AJ80_00893 [Polytolypa hystricis UAMH7299]|uniref:Glucose-methanol-choline oxidoreductase N-terminal domain-containing protein n=1 Tax=Polytolypa hystricis (strain UAMH7299) TaxID=1447883 RepID=A0A2B7Z1E9_POLH7|nr:hypothetical protein AJ80_00893 [Polytolypa hystricis UAMH7299]
MAEHREDAHTVDVIIAGGGATGLVVAGRLAKAQPDLSILVIEAGIDVRDNPEVVNPALFIRNLAPTSNTAKFYKSNASEHVGGRELIFPTGGALGGGSSINFMVYVRAQETDFDDWNTEGWSGKDMIPFLKKYENFQDTTEGIDKSLHGYEGDFSVSGGTYTEKRFRDDFFKACADLGIGKVPDVQNLKTSHGVGHWNKWIDQHTGRRQDVPHTLIYPIVDAANTGLKIITESTIVRVLFNDAHQATGVEYLPTAGSSAGEPKRAYARKLVVIASGAFGTPQILERSGIGDESLLSDLGIPLVSAVSGVGTNYQDHNVVFYPYISAASPYETLDGLLSGRLSLADALKLKTSSPNRHILGWNGIDCFGKIRPREDELKDLGVDLEKAWHRDFRDRETRPLMLMALGAGFLGNHATVPVGQYFTTGAYPPYPYSRGSIHITGRSIADPPNFDSGFFSDPVDAMNLVWGYKKQREIARRLADYRGPLKAGHPEFAPDSKANPEVVDEASKIHGYPVPIEYSEEDNKVIENFIRQTAHTAWHSMGTCAMKPRENGGVVDKDLNVYGVSRLKVVDLSICPGNVAANTYSTALAVSEKAASIIAKELGIPYPVGE